MKGAWSVLAAAAALPGLAGEGDPDFYDARRAVALVKAKDVSGTVLRTGQGFFLRSGNLVTARHLLEGARGVTVTVASGREFPAAGVVAEDPGSDLALLYAEVPEEERHFLQPAARGPRRGEKAWLLARRADGSCAPSVLEPTRAALLPGLPGVFGAAPGPGPGDAGAPILNRGLAVLGVAVAWAGEGGAAPGFAIPADAVRRLDPVGLRTWVQRAGAPSPHGPAFAAAATAFVEERWEDAARAFAALSTPLGRAAAAESRRRAGGLEEALAAADAAVQADGGFGEAHRVRGAVLFDLKRLPDADAAFRRAVEIDPGSTEAALGLGAVLVRAGRGKEAIPVLEKAARLSESDARPVLGLARARFQAGDFGGACEDAERAAARDPDHAEAREFLGRLQAMAGELDEAERSAVLLDALDAGGAKRVREVIARIRDRMKEPKKGRKE